MIGLSFQVGADTTPAVSDLSKLEAHGLKVAGTIHAGFANTKIGLDATTTLASLAAMEQQATSLGDALDQQVRSPLSGLTDAERTWAAQLLDSRAKLEAQAAALGVSAGELGRYRAAQAAAAAADQASAQALDSTTEGMSRASRATGQLAYQISDVITMVGMGSSPFQVLISQGPQIAQVMHEAGGAAKLFSASMSALSGVVRAAGPVVLGLTGVAAAGAAAWGLYTSGVEEAAAKAAEMQSISTKTATATEALYDASLKLAYLRGDISERELNAYTAAKTASDLYSAVKLEVISRINEEQVAINQLNQTMAENNAQYEEAGDVQGLAATRGSAAASANQRYTEEIEKRTTKQGELAAQLGDLVLSEQEYAQVLAETADLEGANTTAIEKRDKAVDEWFRSMGNRLAGLQEFYAGLTTQIDQAIDQLTEFEQRVSAGIDFQKEMAALNQSPLEKEQVAYQERLAALKKFRAEGILVEADYYATLAEIEQAYRSAQDEAAQEQRQQQIEDVLAAGALIAQGLGDIGQAFQDSYQNSVANVTALTAQLAAGEEYYTEAQEREIERRIEAQKKAARNQFQLSKDLRAAEAEIAATMTFLNVLASNPTPFGLIQAGIMYGLAQAKVAVISSEEPTFHRGGLGDDLDPDEYRAKLTRNEAVLNPLGREVTGDETIRDRNAGIGGSAPTVVVVSRYDHKIYNDFSEDNLKMGSPISELIQGTGNTGNNNG